jgi:hypothetical protein
MGKLVVLRKTALTPQEVAERLDHYFQQAGETVRPFVTEAHYAWNARRTRATIHAGHVKAEVVLLPRQVMVMVDVPFILLPVKGRLEAQVARALDAIVGSDQQVQTGRESCS